MTTDDLVVIYLITFVSKHLLTFEIAKEKKMENKGIFEIHSNFCTVMSNEKRLHILWLLGTKGELSVSEISETLHISMANASQHLRIMRDQNAVVFRKDKQTVYYKLSNPLFFEGCKLIHKGLLEIHTAQSKQFANEETNSFAEFDL